jgi:hypothetical protein
MLSGSAADVQVMSCLRAPICHVAVHIFLAAKRRSDFGVIAETYDSLT